jgi:ATP-dependent helicase HrpA
MSEPSIADLRARAEALPVDDGRAILTRLERAERALAIGSAAESLSVIERAIAVAEAYRSERQRLTPTVRFPAELPITEHIDRLRGLIEAHQVIVVAGETGSGKSTQIPKLLVDMGRGTQGRIGHTQPRRLAARTVAERIAEELGSELGGLVGCTVRFSDTVGDNTLVKVMTDGILLAETRSDRDLRAYDTIIIDEAHERSLNIDFLLGYLRRVLSRRPDLKVIITSATIDTEKFSKHFGGAPIVEVSGRTYPVEVRYRPFGADADSQPADTNERDDEIDEDIDEGQKRETGQRRDTAPAQRDDRDQTQAIIDAVDELASAGPGDVLVFLSGEREIHDTADALRAAGLNNTEIVPLYARLGLSEQRRIFQPHQGRRVVLATNVAETSLTVPGIRYVVDAGTARMSRYNRRLKVQRLPIEPVSQASANQRAGRCGRVAPGICIRLYSEESFSKRPPFTEPEILRTNLASVVLQAASLGLGDTRTFPFVDPPDSRAIKDGVLLLEELGAFTPGTAADPDDRRLTPRGTKLARLPVDPRLATMVLEAEHNNCAREVLIIAAALSIQDPRERPTEKRAQADQSHARFAVEGSDFLSYLKLWDHIKDLQRELSKSAFRRRCRDEYLNYLRVREWQDVERQLRDVAKDLGIVAHRKAADPDLIHRSILVGLLSQIGMRPSADRDRQRQTQRQGQARPSRRELDQAKEFLGARNAKFMIAPGSVLSKRPPRWVMAAELVETNRLWARVTASINPEWIERLASHVVSRSYSDPRWEARRGSVVATERVSLYGLSIVDGRTVDYARIDPVLARELFIRSALVDRDWSTKQPFFAANGKTMATVRALEDRARRRDVLLGPDAMFDLFDAALPSDVVSGRHLDRWVGAKRQARNAALTFTAAQLIDPEAGTIRVEDFPDTWTVRGHSYPLSYVYRPGELDDGVTVMVPLAALQTLHADDFVWMIAGHRPELVAELLRSLPKQYRRPLSPISEHVGAFLAGLGPEHGPLLEVLAAYCTDVVRRESGGQIWTALIAQDFNVASLPAHVRFTIAVESPTGAIMATGKSVDALASLLATEIRNLVVRSGGVIERSGLTEWSFGDLPQTVEVHQGGHVVRGYPTLSAEREGIAIRISMDRDEQVRSTRSAVRRLLAQSISAPRKQLEKLFTTPTRLALTRLEYGTVEQIADDCIRAAIDSLVAIHGGPHGGALWTQSEFEELRDTVRGELFSTAAAIAVDVSEIVTGVAAIVSILEQLASNAFDTSVADIEAQLRFLAGPDFITSTGAVRLHDVVRYVRAAQFRAEKLAGDVDRDRKRLGPVTRLQLEIDDVLLDVPSARRAEVMALRWQVEELRISVFAQHLPTAGTVSEARIRRELDRIAPAVAG